MYSALLPHVYRWTISISLLTVSLSEFCSAFNSDCSSTSFCVEDRANITSERSFRLFLGISFIKFMRNENRNLPFASSKSLRQKKHLTQLMINSKKPAFLHHNSNPLVVKIYCLEFTSVLYWSVRRHFQTNLYDFICSLACVACFFVLEHALHSKIKCAVDHVEFSSKCLRKYCIT